MALADILQRIEEDSLDEASVILQQAEEAAAAVRADAQDHARRLLDRTVARATAEAEAAGKTRLATARLTARDRALAAKRQLVEQVISEVADHLETLPADEYVRFIANQVAQVAKGSETLLIGFADEPRLAGVLGPALAEAGAKITIGGPTSEIERGVVVEGDRVKVEVSARALVASRKAELVAAASETLFGGSAEPSASSRTAIDAHDTEEAQ
ncbi:MAG: V-type ATP synthase subunit E [Coriobacteriia bacterium]|nr:V-type ATP synthase subunit E [Coriobacteriia bacterium]